MWPTGTRPSRGSLRACPPESPRRRVVLLRHSHVARAVALHPFAGGGEWLPVRTLGESLRTLESACHELHLSRTLGVTNRSPPCHPLRRRLVSEHPRRHAGGLHVCPPRRPEARAMPSPSSPATWTTPEGWPSARTVTSTSPRRATAARSVSGTDPESGQASCAGLTGSIGRLSGGQVTTVVSHLFSIAGSDGTAAEGPVAVSTQGNRLYAQIARQHLRHPAAGAGRRPGRPGGAGPARADHRGDRLAPGVLSPGRATPTIAWTAAHKDLQPDQFPDANPNGWTRWA